VTALETFTRPSKFDAGVFAYLSLSRWQSRCGIHLFPGASITVSKNMRKNVLVKKLENGGNVSSFGLPLLPFSAIFTLINRCKAQGVRGEA